MLQEEVYATGVASKTALKRVFMNIRRDIDNARSRFDLTELYGRARSLIMLTEDPSWQEKLGEQAAELCNLGEEEFHRTARKINRRAREISTEADFGEHCRRHPS